MIIQLLIIQLLVLLTHRLVTTLLHKNLQVEVRIGVTHSVGFWLGLLLPFTRTHIQLLELDKNTDNIKLQTPW